MPITSPDDLGSKAVVSDPGTLTHVHLAADVEMPRIEDVPELVFIP